jgi:hypothetical protein
MNYAASKHRLKLNQAPGCRRIMHWLAVCGEAKAEKPMTPRAIGYTKRRRTKTQDRVQ